jgi:hypothetical protein
MGSYNAKVMPNKKEFPTTLNSTFYKQIFFSVGKDEKFE